MAKIKDVVENRRKRCTGFDRLRAIGGRYRRKVVDVASHLGHEIIRREAACAALSLIFASTVVVPGILIFFDRSLPFEYVDTAMVEKTALPGQRVHFRLTVRKVDKTCRGHVDRVFLDATGRVFPLRAEATAYQYFRTENGLRIVERSFTIPDEAAPGEGTYASFPEFWCYPLQFLWPIKAPPLRAKLLVLSPQTSKLPPGSLPSVPPGYILVPVVPAH